MIYVGIDPGDTKTALVVMGDDREVLQHKLEKNREVMLSLESIIESYSSETINVGIEMIASYGMAVGKTVFETCVFIGVLVKEAQNLGLSPKMVYRREAKMHLCGSMKAKDANIRQAIIDLYPATGGGVNPVIGIKSNPGPLFGMAKDKWAALSICLTAQSLWDDLQTFPYYGRRKGL